MSRSMPFDPTGQSPQADPQIDPRRRHLTLLALWPILGGEAAIAALPTPTRVEVWKGPSCGCCSDWIEHLQANGFAVVSHDDGNTDARARLGMPLALGSCHTALVEGYVIEGHVPAREIRRLLRERARAVGLAVPGMPQGSPGMDGPLTRGRHDPFDVLLVTRDGRHSVYQAYR